MNEPIMEFDNISQAYECLKEWQPRLFLDDWIINLNLADPGTLILKDVPCAGLNEFQLIGKSCIISIEKLNDNTRTRIVKACHEKTLIHELLHLKYNWVEIDYNQNIPAAYYDTLEHSLLEQMAKSLLMAKYNLTFDWFRNFTYEED